MQVLGVLTALDYSTSLQYISSPCVQALNSSATEAVKAINTLDEAASLAQLARVNVTFQFLDEVAAKANTSVSFAASTDPGVDNRVKWIGLMAAFFNREAVANKVVKDVFTSYNCTRDAVSKVSTKPLVAWAGYTAPSDFNNQTASWVISAAQYKWEFTADAAARNLSSITANKRFTDRNEFLAALKDVDILIDETFGASTQQKVLEGYGLTDKSTEYKFVANKQIWRPDGQVNNLAATAWFESALVFANVVLNDLVYIAHPESLPNYQPTYIRNIFTASPKVLTDKDCTSNPVEALAIPTVACAAVSPNAGGNGKSGAERFGASAGAVVAVAAAISAAVLMA
ncbi:hypothetical protein HK102_009575 [Quaeritorhiza haematococci]|nr:hypothetical protein HK102_009575 [Quaeritorhiza haematococci]